MRIYLINWNFKFRNISVNFEDTKMVERFGKITWQTFSMFKLEYCNNCVHEKMPHGIEDDIKVFTEFSCLLGHLVCLICKQTLLFMNKYTVNYNLKSMHMDEISVRHRKLCNCRRSENKITLLIKAQFKVFHKNSYVLWIGAHKVRLVSVLRIHLILILDPRWKKLTRIQVQVLNINLRFSDIWTILMNHSEMRFRFILW